MATPTRAQLVTDLQNSVKILNETKKYGQDNATNLVGLYDTYVAAINTNFPGERTAGADVIRDGLSSLVAPSSVRAILDPVLRDWGKFIDAPEDADATAILARMYQYFVDNSETVNGRNLSFGTPSADGGNTGNGTIHRLTVDKNNYPIENVQTATSWTAKVIQDQNSGATKHQEVYEVVDSNPGRDELSISGGGVVARLNTTSPRTGKLGNASFTQRGGTDAAPTSLNNWRLLDASDVAQTVSSTLISFDTSNIYLEALRDADTERALQLDSTSRIKVEQKLNVTSARIDRGVPHYLQIAWNRSVNSASGTLALHMGSQSESVAVSAQSGWQILRITVGQKLWLEFMNQNNLDILIDWTPDSGGTGLLIDDVILAPMTRIGNHWYASVPGATPFLVDDKWTWTDAVTSGGSDSIIPYWLWRGYDAYLPSNNAGSETVADPS
jgi:hypothetical protein